MAWFPGKPLDGAVYGVAFGKSAPSAPAAPDPAEVAKAQAGANKEAVQESARVNQINEVSPFGTRTYSGDIGSPGRTVTTSLNATDQATLDQQRQLASQLTGQAQNRAGQITNDKFTLDGISALPTDFSADRAKVEDALYSRAASRLDPQFQQSSHDLEVKLANQGIPVGSEAWQREMDNFSRAKNDAYAGARNDAIGMGGAEEARSFGMAQAGRQQGISDRLLERQQPMNELAAYLQGAPALNAPNFAAPAQYQQAPADVTGAYGLQQSARNAAYQGGVSSANSGNQALAGGLVAAGTTAAVLF